MLRKPVKGACGGADASTAKDDLKEKTPAINSTTMLLSRSLSTAYDILLPGILGAPFEEGVTLDPHPAARLASLSGVSIAVGVQVMNGTRHALIPVSLNVNRGVAESSHMSVAPGVAEALVVRKDRRVPPFHGTHGTATWRIGDTDRLFTLGWSAPYNHLFYSNWLMAAVTTEEDALAADLTHAFDRLYYGEPEDWFERKEFAKGSEHRIGGGLRLEAGGYLVFGLMDSTHKSVVSVTLLPQSGDDMAPSCIEFVNAD